MHWFNKLLKFSQKKKKIAKVTFNGTLILLNIHNTNTIIIILSLHHYYSFNKYLYYWKVVNSTILVSHCSFIDQKKIKWTLINIILLYIYDTNTQTPTIHSNIYIFLIKKKIQSFIHYLFGSAPNHSPSLYPYSMDSFNQCVLQYNLKLYPKKKKSAYKESERE